MGIPLPALAATVGAPPVGDQANAVISGTLTDVGTTQPFVFYGAFNVLLWGTVASALTTTKGSTGASVVSGTGISSGMYVNGVNVPPGTTWATFTGTEGTLAFPPGKTSADVTSGDDSTASFGTVAVAATVQLERSFDGGKTWLICGVGGAGQQAVYTNPQCISIVCSEPEKGVAYRLNCPTYSSGQLNYRLSATGVQGTSNGISS